MKKTTTIIFIYSVIACVLLYITENIFHPTYLIQMIQKIVSFIIIPIFLGKYLQVTFGKFGSIQKSSVIYGFGFGLFGALVTGIAYFLLKDVIEWSAIGDSLTGRGITSGTFVFIFLYIMFGNSLIEEYFFRGIIFRSLRSYSKNFAYAISSIMFALYHFAIFGTWFHGYILGIALFGLIAGGLFFAWLYEKTKGIWGAWIFHIIVDLVILIIGYIEFFR